MSILLAQVDASLPAPCVVESHEQVIDLDAPFCVELPALNSRYYDAVVLALVCTEGTQLRAWAIKEARFKHGKPTQAHFDNQHLMCPFDRQMQACARAYLHRHDKDRWVMAPDSDLYSF